MVYQSYTPATKISAICISSKGFSQVFICNALGYSISQQFFKQWADLFKQRK
ncbi:uncharacterized protein VP01_85g8 [Puccinia sorghi]|uniref:Uncharacterized protein n=1 Tax=Puccinia sorghi TaxID=27349 RepID=A0A0L6U8X2_9BASI|nr:uncharacterized protein VP01_85g8 [Puccinia sorghi]